ncbi:prostaglandin reductase 2-like [Rhopilema esculentum]|uniref:prostaglandin reductase 2-like n=1 Tax=Rhopilema esculentum TaxID=499914 RepID=UPI0031DC3E63|eukprot:gene16323-7712_t
MAPGKFVSLNRILKQTDAPKSEDFTVSDFDENQELEDGEVLVKTLYLSVDPYMKFRMMGEPAFLSPWKVGEACIGGGAGIVLASKFPGLSEQDLVESFDFQWKTTFKIDGKLLNKIENDVIKSNLSQSLGLLGLTGLSSLIGLKLLGHIEPGKRQTAVISGAAGACGSAAGQLARIMGATNVVGICGSEAKCKYLTEDLGFNATVNYKTENVAASLKKACPGGVDTYFDNVGGDISNDVIRLMNQDSHVVVCGQISTYNKKSAGLPKEIEEILISRNVARGNFVVLNYKAEWKEGLDALASWYKEGKIKSRETVTEGIENIGKAFVSMMAGGNIGKQVVKVA